MRQPGALKLKVFVPRVIPPVGPPLPGVANQLMVTVAVVFDAKLKLLALKFVQLPTDTVGLNEHRFNRL